MKKIITTSLLVSTYLCIIILQSCKEPSCGGIYSHGVKSITAEPKRIVGIKREKPSPDLLVESYRPDSMGIPYDSLVIVVENSRLAMAKINVGLSAVYACEAAMSAETVREVVITSSEDYSTDFPKGANLKNMMVAHFDYSVKADEVGSYFDLQYPQSRLYSFRSPPSENRSHTLTIEYKLTDGRIYNSTVENVLIKK